MSLFELNQSLPQLQPLFLKLFQQLLVFSFEGLDSSKANVIAETPALVPHLSLQSVECLLNLTFNLFLNRRLNTGEDISICNRTDNCAMLLRIRSATY